MHYICIGFFIQANNPTTPLTMYKNKTKVENATADAGFNPTKENKITIVASLVPIPEIDTGINVIKAEIDTQVAK